MQIPTVGRRVAIDVENQARITDFTIESPGKGEVLIETIATLISAGTELGTQEQSRSADMVSGYSNVGRIVATGPDTSDYYIGDRVLSLTPHASHVIASTAPHSLCRVPALVSAEDATFGVLGSVAMHGVRKARIEAGEHLMITGMGVVGQLVLRICSSLGAETRIAADPVPERLGIADKAGATHTVDPLAAEAGARISDATTGRGVDVVIEASGYPDVLPLLIESCRIGGRIMLLGSIWHRKVEIDFMDFHEKELTMTGCHQPKCPIVPTPAFPWTQQYNRSQVLSMIGDGRLDVASLISHKLPCQEAHEAYRLLRDAREESMGAVLTWNC